MRMGMPAKTDLSGFKGFGFGAKPAAPPGAPKAGARPAGLSLPSGSKRSQPKAAGASALFQASMAEEEALGSTANLPSWTKITPEARQAQRQAEELQALDPTVFQYDEVIDNEKEEAGMEVGSSMIRTDTALQKKKVGLTVRDNCEVGTGTKRTAKYIEKVLVATDRRKVEQQVIEDRLLKKEKEARKDCEVFVTEGFKDELKKRKKFEDELEEQEERDKRMSAEKQENGLGFASMYRNLLNGGLASSRGGAKAKDVNPAREELAGDIKAEVKEEVKDEPEDEKMDEKMQEDVKQEVKEETEGDGPGHGVTDVQAETPAEKELKKEEVKVVREEKAMSAKERFLARKKGLAAAES